jgi:phosphohistidine phosphatase
MAKKLILYRHGKSDWDADYVNDHERPLAERGRNSAAMMGKLLSASGQTPDLIVTSSALRARQTTAISIEEGGWNADVKVDDTLYYGGPEAILSLIHSFPQNKARVMLVGHEPKWSLITSRLIGGGEVVCPTASMARIDFETDKWCEVRTGTGALRWLLQPSFFLKGAFTL